MFSFGLVPTDSGCPTRNLTVYGLSLGLGRQLLVPAAYWEPLSGSYN